MKTPLRLLLVEDSETDALFLLRELRREYGHEPIFERVETAEEMAAALDGAPWDAVVSDYFVPDFGALKALALLKEKGLDLPFIVVSGVVGEQAAVAAMRAGAHDFVMKNNLARLVPTIERELREAEERRRKRRAEEALRESQERFRSLVRHSSDISVILDADGTILYESPAVEWVLGFRAEERIGTNALDHLHPDDVGTARSKIAEILDKPDDRLSVEYRVRNKEGSWRCFEAIGSNLLHEPAIRGIVVNSRDITERKRTEEALRKSEANLAEAQRVAQVGSWELDLASKELYWSDETYRIFGFVPGEVSPNVQRFTELVHPEDRERVRAMLREASAAGNRCSGEFRITRADWTERVIHSTVEIVHDGEGRPVRAAGTNHDITERKLAEEELRRSEERFRSLVQNSLDVIVVVDANATVSYYSPSVEAVLGYEPEEFVGKNVLQTIPIHSEDLPQARRVFGYAVDNPGVNHSVELRMRHANGTWRTVEATANNLLDDPSVGGIVTNYRDVTERRRVEEKLREAEERFRRAFDDAAIGMVMSTLDARFLQVNGALCEMLGRSEEELLGASFRDVTHPEDVETSVDHVQRLLKGEVSSFELEKRYLHADGHPVWTVVHCSLVRDEADRPLYVIGQIQDITDRKRAEEALRESELRYRAVVEDQTELICRFLPDGTLTFVNEAYCRCFDKTREELIGRNFISLVFDEDREDVKEHLACLSQFSRENPAKTIEHREVMPNGEVRWYQWTDRAIFNGQDRPIEYQGVGRDITVRKRAEEALRVSEANLAEAQRIACVGSWQYDAREHTMLWSDEMYRILGFPSPEQFVPTFEGFLASIHPDDRESVQEYAAKLPPEEQQDSIEFRVVRPDGEVRFLQGQRKVERDETGEPIRVTGTVQDITERKKTEESLKRSVDALLALNEASQLLGSTLEPEEIATRLLEIMRRISGLTTAVISLREEDYDGRLQVWRSVGLEDLQPKVRYTPQAKEALEAALEKEAPRVFALDRSSGDDGSSGGEGPSVGLCLPFRIRERVVGVLEAYGSEALADGETIEILGSLATQSASALENGRLYQDLAERERRLRELVGKILWAQEEERRRVAYEVHDGLAQVAASAHQHLQAYTRRYPAVSQKSEKDLGHALGLVHQTVRESRRIIAGLRPAALDDLGLAAALAQEVDLLRGEGWIVDYERRLGDERLPAAVETALFRVAQEALRNVRKHANARELRLELRRDEGSACLRVRDWGRGFDPSALNTNGPGERVGLAGMRERVLLLGGEFELWSRVGEGTSITVEVPLAGDDDREERPPPPGWVGRR